MVVWHRCRHQTRGGGRLGSIAPDTEIQRVKKLKLLQTNNLATITARTEADQTIVKCCALRWYGFPYGTMTASVLSPSFNFSRLCFTRLEDL
jgi:hypothetical protein